MMHVEILLASSRLLLTWREAEYCTYSNEQVGWDWAKLELQTGSSLALKVPQSGNKT